MFLLRFGYLPFEATPAAEYQDLFRSMNSAHVFNGSWTALTVQASGGVSAWRPAPSSGKQ